MPFDSNGAPEWIRTTGLSLRRRTLYPTELREHIFPESGHYRPRFNNNLNILKNRS